MENMLLFQSDASENDHKQTANGFYFFDPKAEIPVS